MYPSKVNGLGPCPDCGGKAILKDGRHGKFYGCIRFPYCTGSRNYLEIPMDSDSMWKDITGKRLDALEKKTKPRRAFWFAVWVFMNTLGIGLIGAAICCAYNWAAATHDEAHWAIMYPPYMSLYFSIPGFSMAALLAIWVFILGVCASDKHGAIK